MSAVGIVVLSIVRSLYYNHRVLVGSSTLHSQVHMIGPNRQLDCAAAESCVDSEVDLSFVAAAMGHGLVSNRMCLSVSGRAVAALRPFTVGQRLAMFSLAAARKDGGPAAVVQGLKMCWMQVLLTPPFLLSLFSGCHLAYPFACLPCCSSSTRW